MTLLPGYLQGAEAGTIFRDESDAVKAIMQVITSSCREPLAALFRNVITNTQTTAELSPTDKELILLQELERAFTGESSGFEQTVPLNIRGFMKDVIDEVHCWDTRATGNARAAFVLRGIAPIAVNLSSASPPGGDARRLYLAASRMLQSAANRTSYKPTGSQIESTGLLEAFNRFSEGFRKSLERITQPSPALDTAADHG